jgi:histidyl-tRNA synthetase
VLLEFGAVPDPDRASRPQRFAAPRGTADILPEEAAWWRYVRERAEDVCDRFGYRRIETPVFEHAGVYLRTAGAGTDVVEKEVYLFEDRGGDRLALRPEGTAGVVRAYLEHGMGSLPQPVRLFYIAPNFRYDRPQAGRYRQHTQFGVEAIGDGHPLVDAEILDLVTTFYGVLGDFTLRLNTIGDANCRPKYIEALRDYYRPKLHLVCDDDRVRFEKNPMRLLDCKEPRCHEIIGGAPRLPDYLCDACAEHFASLRGYLDALGIAYELDDRLVRGLDYYTRTTFELQPSVEGSQSALCGGGRYDGLAELLGGPPTPGIGFGGGVERFIINLKRTLEDAAEPAEDLGIVLPEEPQLRLFVAHLTPEAEPLALQVARRLRGEGLAALVGNGGRSLKSQMRHADVLGAAYVAIIGEEELRDGMITVRNMATHEERRVETELVASEVAP